MNSDHGRWNLFGTEILNSCTFSVESQLTDSIQPHYPFVMTLTVTNQAPAEFFALFIYSVNSNWASIGRLACTPSAKTRLCMVSSEFPVGSILYIIELANFSDSVDADVKHSHPLDSNWQPPWAHEESHPHTESYHWILPMPREKKLQNLSCIYNLHLLPSCWKWITYKTLLL